MNTWKEVMPDYTLRLWDATSFDFDSVPFVKEAFSARKWAFVADYIRLYALYSEGGIYLDSDVRVFKRFDPFLKYSFFTSHEIHPYNFTDREKKKLNEQDLPIDPEEFICGLNVQAAIMGGAKGNSYLRECMEFYHDKHLLGPEGQLLCEEFIIGPYISKRAEKYGYRYNAQEQHLQGGMIILGPEVFVGNETFLTEESFAIHVCNGSWKERSRLQEMLYRTRNRYPALGPFVSAVSKIPRGIKKLAGMQA